MPDCLDDAKCGFQCMHNSILCQYTYRQKPKYFLIPFHILTGIVHVTGIGYRLINIFLYYTAAPTAILCNIWMSSKFFEQSVVEFSITLHQLYPNGILKCPLVWIKLTKQCLLHLELSRPSGIASPSYAGPSFVNCEVSH